MEQKIGRFIVATNVLASRPPKPPQTGTQYTCADKPKWLTLELNCTHKMCAYSQPFLKVQTMYVTCRLNPFDLRIQVWSTRGFRNFLTPLSLFAAKKSTILVYGRIKNKIEQQVINPITRSCYHQITFFSMIFVPAYLLANIFCKVNMQKFSDDESCPSFLRFGGLAKMQKTTLFEDTYI